MGQLSNPAFLGWTLIVCGISGVLQLIFVTLLYTVGQPFGALSDFSNAVMVLLILPLAFALYSMNREQSAFLSLIALLIGIAGILSTAIASFLIFLQRIDFAQSLPPIIAGFAGIGLMLLTASWIARSNNSLSSNVTLWGILIGTGLASLILLVLVVSGDFSKFLDGGGGVLSNPLIYPGFALGVLGYIGFLIWAIWLGQMMVENKISFPG